MNYITQETAQLIEACKALSDYVHAEQSSTDGQVTYSTSTINHHVFQIRAALAQPAKPMEDFDKPLLHAESKILRLMDGV